MPQLQGSPDPVMDQLMGAPEGSGMDELTRPDREIPPGGIGTEVLEAAELDADTVLRIGPNLDEAVATLTGQMNETDAAGIFRQLADRLSGGRGVEGGEA